MSVIFRLTRWHLELFGKNAFLDIFNLDMSHISSSQLKKAFAISQNGFLSTSIALYDIFARAYAEIKSDLCL